MGCKRPNIVLVMTDQQRADLCRREGYPLDVTPFIDSLAQKGIAFRNAYTTSPVCSPARISTLTGRFPSAHRVRENRGQEHVYYDNDLVDVLRQHDYSTALVGKNHSHLNSDKLDYVFSLNHDGGYASNIRRDEQEKEFDEWLHRLNHATGMVPTPFPLKCQPCYRAVSAAINWIDELKASDEGKNPFFLWLSFPEPHNPYQIPEPYFSMFPAEIVPPPATGKETLKQKGFKWEFTRELGEYVYADYEKQLQRARLNYLGMLRMIDDQVERFVSHLTESGLMEDTLIIFVSDHGDFVGEYGLIRKGPEMPELLMRVPLIFSGNGVSNIGVNNECFVSLVDIVPTLCDLLDIPIPSGVQGRSLLPVISGQSWPGEEFRSVFAEQGYGGRHYSPTDHIDFEHCTIPGETKSFDELNTYSQSGAMRMIRKGNWKLLYDMDGNGQLYNVHGDPLELNNLFLEPKYSGIRSALIEELLLWTIRVSDPLPLPVGKYRVKSHPKNYWTDVVSEQDHK